MTRSRSQTLPLITHRAKASSQRAGRDVVGKVVPHRQQLLMGVKVVPHRVPAASPLPDVLQDLPNPLWPDM
ncbi:hypothetical protein AB5J72_03810 [Streptomyces sp. CG1]|uniref:hypothetical protein n=1 Tax=Streptomyces sp. CG1 TaxID=1287523 RepID=UPI0034E1DA8B